MKRAAPIRLLLADDHYVVRAGLAAVLQFEPRVTVVAEAEDGAQAVTQFREHRSDVTLMDVRMPVVDGLEALRRIRSEFTDARILMFTTSETEADIQAALAAGATGYLLKNAGQSELVNVVLAVHRGERWLPESLAKRVEQDAKESPLSPRQLEVLDLLAKGLSNKEIAGVLGFTTDGVKGGRARGSSPKVYPLRSCLSASHSLLLRASSMKHRLRTEIMDHHLSLRQGMARLFLDASSRRGRPEFV